MYQLTAAGQVLPANQDIAMKLNVKNMQTGVFTDAQSTYYLNRMDRMQAMALTLAAQTVNGQGQIIGCVARARSPALTIKSRSLSALCEWPCLTRAVVVDQLANAGSTTPATPTGFVMFKLRPRLCSASADLAHGIDTPAVNGALEFTQKGGFPAGTWESEPPPD